MSTHDNYVTIDALACMMDDCADREGQWNAADLCDELAKLIDDAGGFAPQCPTHGCYAKSKPYCPFEHAMDDEPTGFMTDVATAARMITNGQILMATTHTPRTPDPELLAPSDAELTIAADRASNCMLHGNITDALEIIRDSGAPETVVLLMVMRDSQDGQVSPPNIVLRLLNAMHVQYNQLG